MNTIKIIIAIVVSVSVNNVASANGSWIVGVAALHADGPYLHTQNLVAPLIMYEKDRLTLSTLDGASYRIFDFSETNQYEGSMSVIVSPRFAPDYGESLLYNDLQRRSGLDIGTTGEVSYGNFVFEFRGQSVMTSGQNGFETNTQISYQSRALPVELGIGVRYRDRKLNQYLFGVNQSESNESLSAYTAVAGMTSFISGMIALPLSRNLMSYLQIEYEDLGTLTQSPLVADNAVSQVILGVIYQW